MQISESLVAEFKSWLLLGDLSPDTVLSYANTVTAYCLDKSFDEMNTKDFFLLFRKSMSDQGNKPSTINRHTFALKKFLTFVNDSHGIPIFNIFSIRCKKPSRPTPKYLEKDEIKKIRALPIQTTSDLLTRTLFEFLLYTGCRISETVNVKWGDITKTGELLVFGKERKYRIVFLGGALSWVTKYLATRPSSEFLFLNQYGRKLDRRDASVRIRELGKRAGLEKGIYPHMLRTTFATHMIRAGVDPRTLQEMLGHEDIETTLKHYIGVSQEHLKEKHKQFSTILA